jgi:hypothetical protein
MKRLITRPRSLVLVAVLAVVAAMCTASTVHAASTTAGIRAAASHAMAASDTPCTINYQATTCQSANPTVTVDNYFTGDQTGCSYVSAVTWGDGQSTTNVTYSDPGDGYDLLGNHTYKTATTYTISVTLQLTAGTCTANSFTAQFTLLSPTPTPTPTPSPPPTPSKSPTPSPPPAPSCPAIDFIGFHGTGQSEADPKYLGMGEVVLQTSESLRNHGTVKGGMIVSAVNPFPAVDLPSTSNWFLEVTQGWAYAQAAINAANTATAQVQGVTASCPKTKFVFVGYSIGALVAHITLQNLSQKNFNMANVAAVVFFGDPIYPQVKTREGVGRAIGLWGNGAPYVPAGLEKRTLSICLSYSLRPPTVSKARVAYDPVCLVQKPPAKDVNLQNCISEKTVNSTLCPHTQYVTRGRPEFAANWLAKILHVH